MMQRSSSLGPRFRFRHRPAFFLVVAVFVLVSFGGTISAVRGAGAVSRISEPATNPYHVAIDASGKPVPFTVVADGLPAGRQAFIEQCDGTQPSAPNWSVDRNCDLGGSPSPVIVNPQGVARFSATDTNHGFVPVMGESPQSLFNCSKPGAKAPTNDLPNFTTCQIRVSTNNVQPTDDQVFLSIVFGGSASTGTSSSALLIVVVVAAVLVLVLVGVVIVLRRRRKAPISV